MSVEPGGTTPIPDCTATSHRRFYSYSFFPNSEWSRMLPPGGEIQQYLRRVADERGLRRHIRFGTEVTAARYCDGRWRVSTDSGGEDEYDVLVTATGFLRVPRVAEIPGRESFAGPAFHSARWDHSVDLRDKRIGLIGTGSTGVQIVAELGGKSHAAQGLSANSAVGAAVPESAFHPAASRDDPQISRARSTGIRILVTAHLHDLRPRTDSARSRANLLPHHVPAQSAALGAGPNPAAQADPRTIRPCASA